MAKMIEEGKTFIFLMPEISLTTQMEKRFKVTLSSTNPIDHP